MIATGIVAFDLGTEDQGSGLEVFVYRPHGRLGAAIASEVVAV
jgi:hypothetical protein